MNQDFFVSYKVLQKDINKKIISNLLSLFNKRELTPTILFNQLNTTDFFSKQHFNRLFNHPESTPISVATLLLVCDFLGISLENLISDNFDPTEYKANDTELHKKYINIEKHYKTKTAEFAVPHQNDPFAFAFDFEKMDTIEFSPKNRFFKGYLQNYYCYYFPTSSRENSEGKILYARLELSDAGNYCKTTLKIDTRGIYPKQESDFKFDKEYVGYTVISSSVRNVYCILLGKDLGDFCFIAFRYIYLNHEKLFCRIAEALSSSSGTEARRPTVLRMFISNTHIKEEHMPLVASSLRLNYSKIAITRENLLKLCQHSAEYKTIVDSLLDGLNNDTFLIFDERKDIITTAEKILTERSNVLEFISQLRNLSYSYKYNKVSEYSDDSVKDLLSQKGYYQKQNDPHA